MLDAVLMPEWEYRIYSYDASWLPGHEMASLRDGQGDHVFVLFSGAGAILKGFAHESPMTPFRHTPPRVWPGVLDDVPDVFSSCLDEPAFEMSATTFCFWRTSTDDGWSEGDIERPGGDYVDGARELLGVVASCDPRAYAEYAQEYFERDVRVDAVERVYALEPLTRELVRELSDEVSWEGLREDAVSIGYALDS